MLNKMRPVGRVLLAAAVAMAIPGTLGAVRAPAVAFVARWGGVTKDIASAVVAPHSGSGVFVVGSTFSQDFPVTAGRRVPGQQWCAFATKLSADTGALAYSTCSLQCPVHVGQCRCRRAGR